MEVILALRSHKLFKKFHYNVIEHFSSLSLFLVKVNINIFLGFDHQDSEPGSAGLQLQADQKGSQRGHQDPEPWTGRVHCVGRRQRAPGDSVAHPTALRGQECSLRVCPLQAGSGPCLWRLQASHLCQVLNCYVVNVEINIGARC